MMILATVFFVCISLIVFIYGLYGPILYIIRSFVRRNKANHESTESGLPSVSLIIPAYNEEGWIEQKIDNSLNLNYPKSKLEVIVVTDGSTDDTPLFASAFRDEIIFMHEAPRKGKISAMDRAAMVAGNDILVYTDANTTLNDDALLHIAEHFEHEDVGMVSGEKRVLAKADGESAQGEGLYWKYESWLKKLDSDVATVIGVAGELFAIKKALYQTLPADTLLDDFMLSSKVIEQGYRVAYEKKAVATEYGSTSYLEEWKRKVRICAGGLQASVRSRALFNFSRFGFKSFCFLVHRVSRWTIAPLALLVSYVCSAMLVTQSNLFAIYFILGSVALGLTIFSIYTNKKNLPKLLLLIVYFTFMHISAIAGWFRYLSGKQQVNWERAVRITG
ncbi:MAG: glycosyltransferase family 2 protein [Bacteroidota bacterium]